MWILGWRLGVRYTGNGGVYPIYQCVWKHREALASRACLTVPAVLLDQAITERLVGAITPVTIELALAALTSLEERDREIGAQWRMRIESARYDADLAERRYEAVDPSNRSIAATLETRWNDAMQRLHDLEAELAAFEQKTMRRHRRAEAADSSVGKGLPSPMGGVDHQAARSRAHSAFAGARHHRPEGALRTRSSPPPSPPLSLLAPGPNARTPTPTTLLSHPLLEPKLVRLQVRWQGGETETLQIQMPQNRADVIAIPRHSSLAFESWRWTIMTMKSSPC